MPHLSQPTFDVKDRVAVLFKEYDTLRAEVISRGNAQQQYLTFGATAAAAIFVLFAKDTDVARGVPLSILRILAVTPFAAGCFAAALAYLHTRKIGRHLRHVENKINQLIGGEELLIWELTLRHRPKKDLPRKILP